MLNTILQQELEQRAQSRAVAYIYKKSPPGARLVLLHGGRGNP